MFGGRGKNVAKTLVTYLFNSVDITSSCDKMQLEAVSFVHEQAQHRTMAFQLFMQTQSLFTYCICTGETTAVHQYFLASLHVIRDQKGLKYVHI